MRKKGSVCFDGASIGSGRRREEYGKGYPWRPPSAKCENTVINVTKTRVGLFRKRKSHPKSATP